MFACSPGEFSRKPSIHIGMHDKILKLLPLSAAIAVFVIVFYFLVRILPGMEFIELDLQSDHSDYLRIYYSNVDKFGEEALSPPFLIKEQRSKIKVPAFGKYVNYLRIDTGGHAGTVKIFQLKVASYFHAPLVLGPTELGKMFVPGPETTLQVDTDHLRVIAHNNDPYFFGKTRLFPPMYWQSTLVALVFAGLAGMIVWSTSREKAIRGSAAKLTGAIHLPDRFDALDGLRGFAAVMVIADHTIGWFSGVGATGVWIFFALSGFLLARPFIGNAEAVLSFAFMADYFKRRLLRILPMYYAYIFVVFLLSKRYSLAIMHGLFLEGDGHLWALPQELVFYLLWPMLVLLVVLPLQKFPKITVVALFLLMAAWNKFVGVEVMWLLGMAHDTLPLFFGIFLAGVFFSFLFRQLPQMFTAWPRLCRVAGRLASPLGFALIVFFLLFSTGRIFGKQHIYSQEYFGCYGFLAGFLVLCVVSAKGRMLDTFLTLAPLRELGRVGLSLYLVHPVVKNLIDGVTTTYFGYKIKDFRLFLATLLFSYLLARYTFSHIEQPGFSGNLNNKQ